MPYVQIRTSVKCTEEQLQTIKNAVSPAISLIPGKSEAVLMIEIVPDCRLFIAGNEDAPTAYVAVYCNNDNAREDLLPYSRVICETLNRVIGVPMNRIYITHQGRPEWHSGKMFL